MTITIELPSEIEAGLASQAAAHGIPLQQYLQQLLEDQVPSRGKPITPGERAALWRHSATGLPRTPPLPDQAITRETIYDTRG